MSRLAGEIGQLWDYMGAQPVVGHLQIEVSKKGEEPARKAIVGVRFSTVTLKPPPRSASRNKEKLEPVTIDAVWVKEVRAPDKVEPLEPYLILGSIIAWRLFWMTKINRGHPDALCTVVLAEHEWKGLYCIIHGTTKLPEKLPPVREVIHWIGQLGGFLGRKGDREPGITVIWRGWQRLTHRRCIRISPPHGACFRRSILVGNSQPVKGGEVLRLPLPFVGVS
jgi:hypothetical protein